jgi:nitrate/nitrite-specific signal transduction histidine kinase
MKNQPGGTSEALVERVREGAQRHLTEIRAENDELRALLERERETQVRLQGEMAAILARSERNRDEFMVVEEQNAKLASLFVSSSRLHESTERKGVLEAIHEIVINLIGSEELAVFVATPDGSLRLESSMGVERARFEHVPPGRGIIGDVVAKRQRFVRGGTAPRVSPNETELTACIPFVVDDRVIGALAIFRLLPQKTALEAADLELLDLLATQAAIALDYSELLRARRERSGKE